VLKVEYQRTLPFTLPPDSVWLRKSQTDFFGSRAWTSRDRDIAGTPVVMRRVTQPPAPPSLIRYVTVYSWPGLIMVGDTLTISASGFDSTGSVVSATSKRTWTLLDSALVVATPLGSANERLHLTGRQAGNLVIRAAIEGVTGIGAVRVIPTLAPLVLQPPSLTLRPGESQTVRLRITDLNGTAVQNLAVVWTTDDASRAILLCCSDSTVITARLDAREGETVIRAKVARREATLPVKVVAR
jgi:hypothetical protein